jgi:diguanylate cyclase (GGDEF)-like protein
MLSAVAFALFALRELDAALRRLYLHGLVQTLRIADLAARNRSLDELSATDALTGAGNRRQFEKALAALKPSPNLSHFLFLIDIDHFKQLNDKFGHQTGDACLRAAVEIMSKMLRPGDTIARVGGDEFAILLIQSSLLDARRIADRLCGGVPSQGFEAEGRIHQMSVSIGCAEWDLRYDSDRFFSMADAALYHAKRAGKGRVFWAQPDVAERAANSVSDDGAENFAA